MDRNFARALQLVLKHEGGFVNHPSDPGGATNKGVTIGTFRRYVKKNGTVEDLKRITDEQVAKVYRKQYWNVVKGNDLPDGVDYAVFDFAVNSGPARSAKFLQSIVGAVPDGKIGPLTLEAVSAKPAAKICEELCDRRMTFLRGLKTWPDFGKGWTRRVDDVRAESLAMIVSRPRPAPHKPVTPSPAPVAPKEPNADPGAKQTGFWASLVSIFNRLFGRD